MCRQGKTYRRATLLVLSSFTVFCSQALAEQSEPVSVDVGLGAAATHSGIAIGWDARAHGNSSIAIGAKSRRFGMDEAYASNGGVAIGTGSRSTTAGDVNFGSRKLSGLKDGAMDDEAVTVRQMKAAQAYTDNVRHDLVNQIGPAQARVKAEAVAAAAAYSDAADSQMLELARAYTDQTRREDLNYYTEHVGRAVLADANDFSEMRSQQAEHNAVTRSRQYTDKRVDQVQSQMKRYRKRALGGIAGAMAMTTLTPPPAGANTALGVSVGSYGGQMALASGMAFRTGKNSHLRVNTSWDTSGGVGLAAGYNLAW